MIYYNRKYISSWKIRSTTVITEKNNNIFGTDSISKRGSQIIWKMILGRLKLLRTLNKLKKEIKSGNVMPAQIGCATCTSSTLALSTGNCKIHVFLFINRTFSTRIHVTAILSSIVR